MIYLVAWAVVCYAEEPSGPVAKADQAAYRVARAAAGRSAEAHIKLSLWCEVHGLPAERLEHLAMAAAIDPTNAAARGLMGLVQDGGRWRRPDDVAERAKADAKLSATLADYAQRREKAPRTADARWKLAVWCEGNGLTPEAQAHFGEVVRLDPTRTAAWKRLGCKNVGGRWVSEAQLAAEKSEREAQAAADKVWKGRVEKIRADLRSPGSRADAEAALSRITDPRAVPSVVRAFAREPGRLIQILGQIDSRRASRLLAALAVFADAEEDRRAATETLRGRDPREYADALIGLLDEELKYEVRPVGGPGSPGVLLVQGQKFNVQRLYSPPALPAFPLNGLESYGLDDQGFLVAERTDRLFTSSVDHGSTFQKMHMAEAAKLQSGDFATQAAIADYRAHSAEQVQGFLRGPNNREFHRMNPGNYEENILFAELDDRRWVTTPMADKTQIPIGRVVAEHQTSAAVAQEQLKQDIAAVERNNTAVRRLNERILGILRGSTGADCGANRVAWRGWYIAQLGYNYRPAPEAPRPTLVEEVPLAYLPTTAPLIGYTAVNGPSEAHRDVQMQAHSRIGSCFAAGTPVQTFSGPRPIETLRVGDRVLALDTSTGGLGYRPIVAVHHNPPSETFRVEAGGESVIASKFHRFWIVGTGWKMAKDLRPGDVLRTLDGTATVTAVEPDQVQPVFNLDVATARTFYAGPGAVLVHDNSVPDLRNPPFDAAPALSGTVGGPASR